MANIPNSTNDPTSSRL